MNYNELGIACAWAAYYADFLAMCRQGVPEFGLEPSNGAETAEELDQSRRWFVEFGQQQYGMDTALAGLHRDHGGQLPFLARVN